MFKDLKLSDKTSEIIAAFYEVYNVLGYGFIENVYQNALYKELQRMGIPCVAHPKINVYTMHSDIHFQKNHIPIHYRRYRKPLISIRSYLIA